MNLKIFLRPTQNSQTTKNANHMWWNKEILFFSTKPNKMIHQKNHMDPATTVHHPPENEVDFELLWRCIYPKLGINLEWLLMREIVIMKYRYGYYKSRGIFTMFIIVREPFGIVTGHHSGSLWRMF